MVVIAAPNAGRMLAVLTPWDKPTYVCRAWCVYELLCAVRTGVVLDVRAPASEVKGFAAGLVADVNKVTAVLARVRTAEADTSVRADRDRIHELVEGSVGFDELDTIVLVGAV